MAKKCDLGSIYRMRVSQRSGVGLRSCQEWAVWVHRADFHSNRWSIRLIAKGSSVRSGATPGELWVGTWCRRGSRRAHGAVGAWQFAGVIHSDRLQLSAAQN